MVVLRACSLALVLAFAAAWFMLGATVPAEQPARGVSTSVAPRP